MKIDNENFKNIDKYHNSNRIEIGCVIFNLDNDNLKTLLVKQVDDNGVTNWRLANTYISEGETIASTASKLIKKHTDSEHFFLEQLKAFGYSSESSLHENISIAYYGLVKSDQNSIENQEIFTDFKWVCVNEMTDLNTKDKAIFDFSIKELRKNICQSTIGFNLLPEKFTLLQVVHLYEKILGIEINKSNFRRKILQLGLVENLNEKEENVSHRAARFYTLSSERQEMFLNRELNLNFFK